MPHHKAILQFEEQVHLRSKSATKLREGNLVVKSSLVGCQPSLGPNTASPYFGSVTAVSRSIPNGTDPFASPRQATGPATTTPSPTTGTRIPATS